MMCQFSPAENFGKRLASGWRTALNVTIRSIYFLIKQGVGDLSATMKAPNQLHTIVGFELYHNSCFIIPNALARNA